MGAEEMHTGFWWENLRDGDHLENPRVYWWIILKWVFKKWNGDKDWIDLAQDRNRWQALVNAAMKLQIP